MAVSAQVRGSWRIAIGGIAGVPLRVPEAEALLDDSTAPDAVRAAAKAAAAAVNPGDDLHASSRYRRAMVEEYAHRSMTQALSQGAHATSHTTGAATRAPSDHTIGVS